LVGGFLPASVGASNGDFKMATLKCPTCDKSFDSETSTAMPFCSFRCKQIDLGRWLSEEQRLPYLRPPDDEEDAAASEQDQ
jgi:uncharacterized protein